MHNLKSNKIILSKNNSITLENGQNYNGLILGRSGSGKTRSFVQTNLLEMNGSYVIIDTAYEVFEHTFDFLIGNGYNVKVVSLLNDKIFEDKAKYCTYNPLLYCKSNTDILKLKDLIMESNMYVNSHNNKNYPMYSVQNFIIDKLILSLLHLLIDKSISDKNKSYFEIEEIKEKVGLYESNFYGLGCLIKKAISYDMDKNNFSNIDFTRYKNNSIKVSDLVIIIETIRTYESKLQGCSINEIVKPQALKEWDSIIHYLNLLDIDFLSNNLKECFYEGGLNPIEEITRTDTIDLNSFPYKKTVLFLIIPSMNRIYNFLFSILCSQLVDIISNFHTSDLEYSKKVVLANGELVKFFSKKELQLNAQCADDFLGKIKDVIIKEVVINNPTSLEEMNNNSSIFVMNINNKDFDKKLNQNTDIYKKYYEIRTKDGELLTCKIKYEDVQNYIDSLQEAQIIENSANDFLYFYNFFIDVFEAFDRLPIIKKDKGFYHIKNVNFVILAQSLNAFQKKYGFSFKELVCFINNFRFLILLDNMLEHINYIMTYFYNKLFYIKNSNDFCFALNFKKLIKKKLVFLAKEIKETKLINKYSQYRKNCMRNELKCFKTITNKNFVNKFSKFDYWDCFVVTFTNDHYIENVSFDKKLEIKEHSNYKYTRYFLRDLLYRL